MTTVRCKMKCTEIKSDTYAHSAVLEAVVGDSEENKKFFKATPSGRLEVGVMAGQHFEPNKEYYIDITEAP